MRGLLVLLFVATFLAGPAAWACSCAPPRLPAEQLAASPLAFEGEVEDITDRWNLFRRVWTYLLTIVGREPDFNMAEYYRSYGFEFTFKVNRMWRGPGTRTVKVLTGRGSGDCGYGFERGSRYLVYAYDAGGGEWYAMICSRTRELRNASEDIKYLRNVRPLPLKP